MPLLVVPLASDEVGDLTLGEWDALRSSRRVLFEDPNHLLIDRLRAEGVEAGPFDDEPDATKDGLAFVAEPGSARVIELARAGASVTSGGVTTPDDLTAAHAAPVLRRASKSLGGLIAIMARLRSDDGCPWDREQTHDSLKVHLIEEAHEVIETIEEGNLGEEFEEELGDLLLQVAFHARLAEQDGRFDAAGVGERIVSKLVHRHPHVFGETEVAGASDVVRNWEQLKQEEKAREDPFDGIPKGLPSLLAAYKTQKKAAALGFNPDPETLKKELDSAVAGPPSEDSLGEALFWLVAAARAAGIDPEGALRKAVGRFRSTLS
jgi:tetrapyrrole methylase family protein/MazG family protein